MLSPDPSLLRRDAQLTPDQLASVASGVPLKVDRMSAGDAPSHIRQVQAPGRWGFDLLDLASDVVASGGLPPQCVAVLLIGRAAGSIICGVPLEDGMILEMPVGTEVTASVRAGAFWAGFVVPAAIWHGTQAAATGMVAERRADDPGVFRSRVRGPSVARPLLESLAERIAPGAAAADPAPPSAYTGFLAALAEDCAADRAEAIDRSVRTRLRQAWTAREFIDANLAEPISVERLCQEVGASRRQLEYAFRTMFDTSPQKFLHQARLNEARRRLMAGRRRGVTVTQVALEVGVQHLGRFASAYAAFFGESPRQTLAMVSASVACGPPRPARHAPGAWPSW
jgi:AraC family ethanolamine operon transcriptional activator